MISKNSNSKPSDMKLGSKIVIEKPKKPKVIREEDAIEVSSKYINLDVQFGQI